MSRRELVNKLYEARQNFAGLRTRQAKLKLNRLVKFCPLAKAFRIALEIEDCSTQGKKYHGEWSNHYYVKKSLAIQNLIEVFKENNWVYGKHKSNDYHTKHIVYFEIPGCEQISFHCTVDEKVPDYPKEWDGKRGSTFRKLETAIVEYFDSERSLI